MFALKRKDNGLFLNCNTTQNFDINTYHRSEKPFIFKSEDSALKVLHKLYVRGYESLHKLEISCLK